MDEKDILLGEDEEFKKEDIKDEIKEDVKGLNEPIITRGGVQTYDATQARVILYNLGNGRALLDITGIPIGSSYYVIEYNGGRNPNTGYHIRGQEVTGQNGIDRMYSSYTGLEQYGSYTIYAEPTPEPTPEPEVDPETVSGNELLREILREERKIERNVQVIANITVSPSISDNNVSDNQTVTTVSSDGIMTKKISDYSVTESLMLFISLALFVAGLVVLIRKGLPKWN